MKDSPVLHGSLHCGSFPVIFNGKTEGEERGDEEMEEQGIIPLHFLFGWFCFLFCFSVRKGENTFRVCAESKQEEKKTGILRSLLGYLSLKSKHQIKFSVILGAITEQCMFF